MRYGNCPHGEQLSTKLTADDVRDIRINREGLTDRQRAERLGISSVMVFKVRHYERWSRTV